MSAGGTQIHDLGYRAYRGERAGVPWAVRSLAVHSMRRALGLKRSARHKIAPLLSIATAYVPAVALAGFAAFLGGEIIEDLIGFVIVFFAVIWPVIRGLLSAARTNRADFDRRSGRGGSGERPNSLEAFLEGLRDGDDDEEDLARQRREARAERRERQLQAERDRREQRQRMPAGPQVDPFGEDDEEPAASPTPPPRALPPAPRG